MSPPGRSCVATTDRIPTCAMSARDSVANAARSRAGRTRAWLTDPGARALSSSASRNTANRSRYRNSDVRSSASACSRVVRRSALRRVCHAYRARREISSAPPGAVGGCGIPLGNAARAASMSCRMRSNCARQRWSRAVSGGAPSAGPCGASASWSNPNSCSALSTSMRRGLGPRTRTFDMRMIMSRPQRLAGQRDPSGAAPGLPQDRGFPGHRSPGRPRCVPPMRQ